MSAENIPGNDGVVEISPEESEVVQGVSKKEVPKECFDPSRYRIFVKVPTIGGKTKEVEIDPGFDAVDPEKCVIIYIDPRTKEQYTFSVYDEEIRINQIIPA